MSQCGGEEDEEQVDYGEDSGEESSMSLNGQGPTTWRRMLCSRCIPADLLPVNIEIPRVTNVAGTGTIAMSPSAMSASYDIVFLTTGTGSIMMKDLNHADKNLTVKVIDIDTPGTGRIPRTLIKPYHELQPESKRAFERAYDLSLGAGASGQHEVRRHHSFFF